MISSTSETDANMVIEESSLNGGHAVLEPTPSQLAMDNADQFETSIFGGV